MNTEHLQILKCGSIQGNLSTNFEMRDKTGHKYYFCLETNPLDRSSVLPNNKCTLSISCAFCPDLEEHDWHIFFCL